MDELKTASNLPHGEPPPWLPNWEDESAYQQHGADRLAWAWEFLRRNPAYIDEYRRFDVIPWQWGCGRSYADDAPMRYFHADPPALSPDETVAEYRARTGGQEVSIECHIAQRWGFLPLPDPADGAPLLRRAADQLDAPAELPFPLEAQRFHARPYRRAEGLGKFHGEHSLHREIAGAQIEFSVEAREFIDQKVPKLDMANHAIFVFDLREDPEEQIEAALSRLREIRELEPELRRRKGGDDGPQIKTLVDCLRVFDAAWCGVKGTAVAHALGMTAQAHSSRLKTARRLVDGWYKALMR